jgi:hypothetical protein
MLGTERLQGRIALLGELLERRFVVTSQFSQADGMLVTQSLETAFKLDKALHRYSVNGYTSTKRTAKPTYQVGQCLLMLLRLHRQSSLMFGLASDNLRTVFLFNKLYRILVFRM